MRGIKIVAWCDLNPYLLSLFLCTFLIPFFKIPALGLSSSVKNEMVRFLADGTKAQKPYKQNMAVFLEFGCKEEWLEDNELEKTRSGKAGRLVEKNPDLRELHTLRDTQRHMH